MITPTTWSEIMDGEVSSRHARHDALLREAVERYEAAWKEKSAWYADGDDRTFYEQRKDELDRLCHHNDHIEPHESGDPTRAFTACRTCGRIFHG